MKNLTIADEVWVATCSLHKAQSDKQDFAVAEIRDTVFKLFNDRRPGVQTHLSSHCVSNKVASPNTNCYLYEATPRRRRLFRNNDQRNPTRVSGSTHPTEEDLDSKYTDLLRWYLKHFSTENKILGAMATDLTLKSGSRIYLKHISAEEMIDANVVEVNVNGLWVETSDLDVKSKKRLFGSRDKRSNVIFIPYAQIAYLSRV